MDKVTEDTLARIEQNTMRLTEEMKLIRKDIYKRQQIQRIIQRKNNHLNELEIKEIYHSSEGLIIEVI